MTATVRTQTHPHVLQELALLADGHRAALCGPRGDIVWLCVPRWDSEACLQQLVGGEGTYSVTPVEQYVWGGYYEEGTLIWRHRWVTTAGIAECRDALAYPGDPDVAVLLRRLEAVDTEVAVDVVLDIRAAFGRHGMDDLRRDDDGVWTARSGDLRLRWSGAAAAGDEDGQLRLRLVVEPGRPHDLVLEVGVRAPGSPVDAEAAWAGTSHSWNSCVPDFAGSVAPRDARHAYAVLRGLTAPGSGMVAAPTLGLPERAEAGRNYDYRYVWIRDQAYAGLAASVLEPLPLLDEAVEFVTARLLEDGDTLRPAYRVDGTDVPSESTLGLPGYPGGRDVVGNWVRGQFQLDTLGEILQLLAAAARHDRLDTDAHRAIGVAVSVIESRWDEPDAGIWELDNAWWTHSRLACVGGLSTLATYLPASEGGRLTTLADSLLAETSRRCLDARGFWRRSPEHRGTDAALLLPPVRGALPATDPRTVATLAEVEDTLAQDGYVYRFAADARRLGEAEGAFLLCGFTMAMAHWHQGDETSAFRWFERNRAACGPPGLLSEEYDVQQRQLRGNIPQAFVHAALLETSLRLAAPESRSSRR